VGLLAGFCLPLANARASALVLSSPWRSGFNKLWAGYAITGPRFRAVRGTFIQPAMGSCRGSTTADPEAPIANNVFIWSGLDGLGTPTVEQVGTEIICEITAQGPSVSYFAWFETFPEPVHEIPVAIHPGDQISTEVKALDRHHFLMTLEDRTTASRFSHIAYQRVAASRSSAEWIDEPEGIDLPSITPTVWSSLSATAGGRTASIGRGGNGHVSDLKISDAASNQHVEPSPLGDGRSAFATSWLPGASV
jgi:hypothetical protein